MVTSSVLLVQGALAMVHLNTYVVPSVPVKVVAGSVLSAKLPPAPDTIDQVPAPIVGVLAASVVLVTPQRFI